MLYEQDQRAVEAMARCEMTLQELCYLFPKFDSKDIREIMEHVAEEQIRMFSDMHAVSRSC